MTKPVVLNLANLSTSDALHEALAAELAFPDYYGKNWDAFWDCISSSRIPHLCLRGHNVLSRRLPRDARHLRECLEDLRAVNPFVVVTFEDA